MLTDDKVGIVFGRLALMDEFGSFDGKVFKLDEKKALTECRAAKKAGANIVRTMGYGVWGEHKYGRKSQFCPFMLGANNRWELDQRNAVYFDKLVRYFTIVNGEGLAVKYDLIDGCELRGLASTFSPWVINNQGVTEFYSKAADKFTVPYFEWCWDAFHKFDIIWSFGNEPENRGFPGMVKRVHLPFVKLHKIDTNRLSYGATTKPEISPSIQDQVRDVVRAELGMAASRNIVMPDHGFPFTTSVPITGKELCRKECSSDGYYFGHSACDKSDKGARPSQGEWIAVVRRILTRYPISAPGRPRLWTFETLPAGFSTGTLACWMLALSAIRKACDEVLGA
jgi:hypothetical protein